MENVISMRPEADPEDVERANALVRIEREAGNDALTDEEAAFLERVYPSKRTTSVSKDDHHANLAEFMEENDLDVIGQRVVEWFDDDEASREEWRKMSVKGMRSMGVSPNVDGGADFDGASTVVHPVLAEGVVQFNARAIGEMWPAEGPVKAKILGRVTVEREGQRDRVQDFMNYMYLHKMPDAFDEEDSLLFRLPLEGSMFKKVSYDPLCGQFASQRVSHEDFVVPYSATSLETAVRYTHVLRYHPVDIERLMKSGYYREVELSASANEGLNRTEVHDEIDDIEGRQQTNVMDDERYTFLEMHVELDLKAFPNMYKGKDTGLPLPYVVTVDYESNKVMSIRRNWRKCDDHKKFKRKRLHFVHKKFLPGFGFYGHGLYHTIGGMTDSATGALRALLDAAAFSNLQGGFRSRDAKVVGGDDPLRPGEWRETEADPETLARSFFHVPYREPSSTLFNLLGYLDERASKFVATTETLVGDGGQNMPVGTILARIEQGTKVFSSINRRLHVANAKEYKILSELCADYMPEEYPYEVEGASRIILREDFDERVDIVSVSDPNAVSMAQRLIVAEAVMEKAMAAPQLYDMREVHARYLRAIRFPDVDVVLPDPGDIPRAGPVDETLQMSMGKPVKAYIDQDHLAHRMVHEAWFMGLPPDQQQLLMPGYMAHQAEHLALEFRAKIQEALGIPLPESPFERDALELDPDIEAEITARSAQAVQLMAQQMQAQPQKTPEQIQAEGKVAAEAQMSEAKIARENAEMEAELERKRRQAQADEQQRAILHAQRVAQMESEHEMKLRMMREQMDLELKKARADANMKLAQDDVKFRQEKQRRDAEEEDRERKRMREEKERNRMEAEREKKEEQKAREVERKEAEKKKNNGDLHKLTSMVERLAGMVQGLSDKGSDPRIDEIMSRLDHIDDRMTEADKAAAAEAKLREKRRVILEEEIRRIGDDRIDDLVDRLHTTH